MTYLKLVALGFALCAWCEFAQAQVHRRGPGFWRGALVRQNRFVGRQARLCSAGARVGQRIVYGSVRCFRIASSGRSRVLELHHAAPGHLRDAVLRGRPGFAENRTQRLSPRGHQCGVAPRGSHLQRAERHCDRVVCSRGSAARTASADIAPTGFTVITR